MQGEPAEPKKENYMPIFSHMKQNQKRSIDASESNHGRHIRSLWRKSVQSVLKEKT